jgi:hypothetical protein
MTILPPHVKANVPATPLLPGTCPVAVRVSPADDVERLRKHYGERVTHWEIGEASLLDHDFMEGLAGQRARIAIGTCDALQSSAALRSLAVLDPVFRLSPTPHLVRALNVLTSVRLRAHIDASVRPEPTEVIEKAVDFYLHNPLLNIPIEPFHAILFSMTRRRVWTLWDLEGEDARTNIYIGDGGEISLGKRWVDKALTYGTIDDSWDQLRASTLYSSLVAFRTDVFRRRSQCIFCAHFELCAGFLRAAEDDWPCEPWQRAFTMLGEAIQKAAQLQHRFPPPD